MAEAVAPSGDVALMFTDIEGSTKKWDAFRETFRTALDVHNHHMRESIAAHHGYEVKTIGDSFMVAFSDTVQAALCALDMQRAIEREPFEEIGGMRIRIGLHLGQLEPRDGDYFGPTVNHTARIESAGHGGQIVLSEDAADRIRGALPVGSDLRDDGLHRLKDLGAPIRLFLLSADDLPVRDYPRLRTLDPTTHNFPAQVTSFVGRERETAELIELLNKKARLITLTGLGGNGKTRLAMQVAAEVVQDYPDGIWLVELASLSDPREVAASVALALKVGLAPDQSVEAQVFAHLREKRCLLVFDNFEQVVEAATFVGDLLKQCRNLACLVTSQHLLQIAGEQEYALAPLSLPPVDVTEATAYSYPSVQLFVERAQAARPQFVLDRESLRPVVELCRQLDGSPLALELTAALVRAMTPAQILPRLKDRFKLLASTRRDLDPRQRSLRGALDWSYDLLTEDERSLLAELSVFSGGFAIEDVEAVATVPDAFFLVIALRDKSLLKLEETDGETRYAMLETLRLYNAEKLEGLGQADATKERHARHYLEVARQLRGELHSSRDAMQRMTREIDNMRAGMDWCVERDDAEMISAYARALGRFFLARGLYDEGDRRLALAEAVCRRSGDQQALAQLLLERGTAAAQSGRTEEAVRLFTESYAVSRQLGDEERMIPPLNNLGNMSWFLGDLETARAQWEEALQLARHTHHEIFEARLMTSLSVLARDQGRFDEAMGYLDRSISVNRSNGDRKGLAYGLWHRGETLHLQREYKDALAHLEESQQLFTEIGFEYGISGTMSETGAVLIDCGSFDEAEREISKALASAVRTGDRISEWTAALYMGRLRGKCGDLPRALEHFSRAAQLAAELKERKHMIDTLRYCGEALLENGILQPAWTVLSTARAEYEGQSHYAVQIIDAQLNMLRERCNMEGIDCTMTAVPTASELILQIANRSLAI